MQPKRKLTEWLRLAVLLVEFSIMFVVLMVFSFPAQINDSLGLFRITHEAYRLETLAEPLVYLEMIGFTLFFCKDCINGQSITKRIFKLQIVDNKTGNVATPLQCFIRNTTLLLLPLECLIALIRPDRRIGDKIAGTKLVIYDKQADNRPGPSFTKYILPVALAYTLCIVMAFGLSKISFNNPEIRFVESSYNETNSKKLEKVLTTRFSKNYTVSVKYYDSIENKKLDYVSIICFFTDSYWNNPDTSNAEIAKMTADQVYLIFPKELINGRVQYAYKDGNSLTTWDEMIGTEFTKDDK